MGDPTKKKITSLLDIPADILSGETPVSALDALMDDGGPKSKSKTTVKATLHPKTLFDFSDEERNAPAEVYKGVDNITPIDIGADKSAALPTRYSKQNWSPFAVPKDAERQAFLNQTKGELIEKSLNGFFYQAAGGVFKALGAWDVKGIGDMASGNSEKQYGNWLDDIGNKFLQKSEAEAPIFQSGDMWSGAYWGKQFQSLGLSVGIMAEALGEEAVVGLATGGLGTAPETIALGMKARLLKSMGKQFAFGSMKGVQEAYINALDTQSQTYQKYKDLGFADEVAQKKSAEAASLGFRAESIPLMVLNGLQFAGTFGAGLKRTTSFGEVAGLNPGFSGAAETLIDRLLLQVTNKRIKGTIGTLSNMLSEGAEEGIQNVASTYAQNKVMGRDDPYWDDNMRDSIIGGALGGFVFSKIGKLLEPLTKGAITKRYEYLHDEFLSKAPERTALAFNNRLEAQNHLTKTEAEYNADPSEINQTKLEIANKVYKDAHTNVHLTNTLNALQLDHLTGQTTAFETHVETMRNQLKAVQDNDIPSLQKFNLTDATGKEKVEGSMQHIKDNFQRNIDDSHLLKTLLDNNLTHNTADYQSAMDITKKEYSNHVNTDDITSFNTTLTSAFNHDIQFNQLTPAGQNRFRLESELSALRGFGEIKLSDTNNKRASDIVEQLTNTPEYNSEDTNLLQTINGALYKKGNKAIIIAKEKIQNNNTDLTKLRDPKLIQERVNKRTEDSIKASKDRDSLNQVRKQAEKEGRLTAKAIKLAAKQEKKLAAKDVANEVDGKQNVVQEVARQEKANAPVAPATTQTTTTQTAPIDELNEDGFVKSKPDFVPRNASLFGEKIKIIHDTVNPTQTTSEADEKAQRIADTLLSPGITDPEKMTDEHRRIIKDAVGDIISDGNFPSNGGFRDLVQTAVSMSNKAEVDKIYNALADGWRANNRPLTDKEQADIYTSIYANPVSRISAVVAETLKEEQESNEEKVALENDEHEQTIEDKGKGNVSRDTKGQVVYNHDSTINDNPNATLSTLVRAFETTRVENADGTISITHDYTSDELHEGKYVDNRPLWNPDAYTQGTEMHLRVPTFVDDVLVPIYNEDGSRGEPMRFADWVALTKASPTSQEYKDKIPMIAYDTKSKPEDKGLAFVHDVGWYHPERFAQANPDSMKAAVAKTRAIREAVLANPQGTNTSITITEKKVTTFSPFKTKNTGTKQAPKYEFIPYSEGNPEAIFAIAQDEASFFENEQAKFDNDTNIIVKNINNPLVKGHLYDIRRVGWENGKKMWYAIMVTPQPITQQVRTTVKQALQVYLNYNNTNTNIRKSHQAIRDAVLKASGFDLYDTTDTRDYLRQFINVGGKAGYTFDSVDNHQDVTNVANNLFAESTQPIGYMTLSQSGTVYIGASNTNIIPKQQTVFATKNLKKGEPFRQDRVNDFFKNLDKQEVGRNTKSGSKYVSIMDTFSQNYDMAAARNKRAVAMISETGEITTKAASFREYIMNTLNTNIKAQNVAKEGQPPVYANAASMLSYDLSTNIKKEDAIVVQKIEKPIAPTTATTAPTITQEDKDAQTQADEIIKRLGDRMNIDFNNITNLDDELFFGRPITLEERQEAFNNVSRRVLGLEIHENEEINQFMFHNIIPLLDTKGVVNAKEVREIITKVFSDRVAPYRADIQANLNHLEKLLADFPHLSESNVPIVISRTAKELGKIDKIQEARNIKSLVDAALETAQQRNDIKASRSDQYKIDNDENYEFQNYEEREGWQIDVLSIDPNSNTSGRLKRFYSNIPKLDSKGNIMKGVFDLPMFYTLEEIGIGLKDRLKDTNSDFEEMIDKLKSFKHPWIIQQPSQETLDQNPTLAFNIVDKLMAADKQTQMQFVTDMSNNSLRMGFTMMKWDKYTESYTSQHYDAMKEGVVDQIQEQWKANFKGSKFILSIPDQNGNLQLNKEWAQKNIVDEFNRWVGPEGKEVNATQEEIGSWLKEFGISLSDEALNDLYRNGLYYNYKQVPFKALFLKGGLFNILTSSIKTSVDKVEGHAYDQSGKNPVDESVVNALAQLEYTYDTTRSSRGVYIGGKNIHPTTQQKLAVQRFLDLTAKDSEVRKQLSTISFSKHSMWLRLLSDEGQIGVKTRQLFSISHLAPGNALQILSKNATRDNSLNKLSSLDYETMSGGIFFDTQQGNVDELFPETNINMRMATFLMPSMSDKTNFLTVAAPALSLQNKNFNDKGEIDEDVRKAIFTQVVKPEMERILAHAKLGGKTDAKGYDKLAKFFTFLPKLNHIRYNDTLTLQEALSYQDGTSALVIRDIENNPEVLNNIYEVINDTIQDIKAKRLETWKGDGYTTDISAPFIDRKYLNKFNGELPQVLNMVAQDFAVNQMIQLANSFMMFAGDPAQYFKSESSDIDQIIKDSFNNVGKRLAELIAPGVKLGNSQSEKYVQVFLKDRTSIGDENFIKYVTRILDGSEISKSDYDFIKNFLGKPQTTSQERERFEKLENIYPNSAGYFNIEGSDAQEYTTWQEHLNVLERLGRNPDVLTDITAKDIADARELFSSPKKQEDLTEKERELITLIMQPMKPVYTGQVYEPHNDMMRMVYIKSSAFPLIPQLTQGFEIDHLRKLLEGLENHLSSAGTPMKVRASYQSANKVGAKSTPVDLWDEEGRAKIDNLTPESLLNSHLVLNRRDFRIQQDVPFKSGKQGEDRQSYGTQLMKELWGNGIIHFNNFTFEDRDNWTGVELHKVYTDLHIRLLELSKNDLHDELGLDSSGKPIDMDKSIVKIKELLKEEAGKRGFPKQVLEGLNLRGDEGTREFTLPLWSSINSNKFEALLNAIVSNRMSRIKFPGNSYVVGSPEGFKTQTQTQTIEEIDPEVKSQIVYASSWDGDSPKASYKKDGKVNKIQVLVASKFKVGGKLINLLDNQWSEDKGGKRVLRQDKFDKELLNLVSFRIPTTGVSSASNIEIVGFLPETAGDLMIIPSNLTKQKGLDFDIDKENTYQYHHILSNGKFEKLSEKHKNLKVAKLQDELKEAVGPIAKAKLEADIKEAELQSDFIEQFTGDAGSKESLEQKLIQNRIISIYESVLSHPSDELQAKINTVMNTKFSESEAAFIESLRAKTDENWTALSGDYQKMKMMSAAAGILGKGAYSMDITFHSLAEQAAATGNPIELHGEDGELVSWNFGGLSVTGVLGRTNTVFGGRTIANFLDEIGQTGVDNEKLQVMGRVNANEVTLDVYKMFHLLGIDKFNSTSAHSVSNLFMSQPILIDYVKEINNSKSIMSKFEKDKKKSIITKVLDKYNTGEDTEEEGELMTEENLIKAIQDPRSNDQLQRAVLNRFLEMERFGLAIRAIQTTINVDSKGLGKSMFDVIQKRDKLNTIGNGTFIKRDGETVGRIFGMDKLIGDYKQIKDNKGVMLVDVEALEKEGYQNLGDFMIKPTTYVGAINVSTVNTAYNLWKDHLPYDSPVIRSFNNEILNIIQDKDYSNNTGEIEDKQDILSALKKYFSTISKAGFISPGEDINAERYRLFIDEENGNTSVATYVKGLLEIKGNKIIDRYIKSNILFNSFLIESSKVGQPSLLKVNNGSNSWNEDKMYEALDNLMEVRGKEGVLQLPKIGNKQYTLDTLAQDIINMAMLGNAKQEAIQYTKYISVGYLNLIGYSDMMRSYHTKLNQTASNEAQLKFAKALGIAQTKEGFEHDVSEFTTQFIQHNPDLVQASIGIKELGKMMTPVKGKQNEFIYNAGSTPIFIKVFDSKVSSKKSFRLFKFNGETYNRIPLLGVFGMDEYQFGNKVGRSIVHDNFAPAPIPTKAISKKSFNQEDTYLLSLGSTRFNQEDTYLLSSGSTRTVLDTLSKDTSSPYSYLAGLLLPQLSEDTTIKIGDTITRNGKPETDFKGAWNPQTSIITINSNILSNPKLLAQTILHEVTHELTYSKVEPFISDNGSSGFASLKPNSPRYVQDLVVLYNNLKSNVDKGALNAYIKNRTAEDDSKYYGFTSIHEFMTMALTDKGFQDILSKIEYRKTGVSTLTKFKEFVQKVLEAMNLGFNEKYTAAHAVNAIFEVIKADNIEEVNPYERYNTPQDDIENEFQSPDDYPDIKFNIGNTECN